jgi:hypothetical protein
MTAPAKTILHGMYTLLVCEQGGTSTPREIPAPGGVLSHPPVHIQQFAIVTTCKLNEVVSATDDSGKHHSYNEKPIADC